MLMQPWEKYLGEADQATLARGRFARQMGFGKTPALVVIDAQRYMVGEPGEDEQWPSSCGEVGREAMQQIKRLVQRAQACGVPS